MTTETSNAAGMHTCSYACERPECIRAQRDELASRLTTETSNAREWVWMPREPIEAMQEAFNGWRPTEGNKYAGAQSVSAQDLWEFRQRYAAMLAAAPPPAAARGDVRGLVERLRHYANVQRNRRLPANASLADEAADTLEALAAEGVQAGEVEQRARELLAAELYARSLHEDAYPVAVGAVLDGVVAASVAAIASALSQQPEARGVVDGSELRRAVACIGVVGQYLGKDTILRESALDIIDRRLAALTGERNG